MNRFRVGVAAAFVAAVSIASPPPSAQSRGAASPPSTAAPARVEMTVDSIMRGPDLVGYPPSALRWSGDSQKLYFDWRKPGEEESSTYVVDRGGGEPRKLTEAEAKQAPPSGGRWDKARKRVLFSDGGDIIVYD